MKHLALLFVCLLTAKLLFAQGQIDSIALRPAHANSQDSLSLEVHYALWSGGCTLQDSGIQLNGNEIQSWAFYCLGMLPYICKDTITYKLGPLPAGSYLWRLVLDVGMGGPPCTPGIVSASIDTFRFTVRQATATEAQSPAARFGIRAFPAGIDIHSPSGLYELDLSDMQGRTLLRFQVVQPQQQFSADLPSGIYLARWKQQGRVVATRRMAL